jgi:3-deoxy-D-manno-octulosonic-acid transferase
MWHGQFLLIPTLRPDGMEVRPMVARHGDAEIIGEALRTFGVELIRGAGAGGRKRDRGGAAALRAALSALGEGATVAMTADVPPGPARRAGIGIVTLARLSGRPIIPYAIASSRYRSLSTWSRFTVNMPWSRLAVVAGAPLHVAAEADEAGLEAARAEVERALNQVTRRAYQLAGADPARATPESSADYAGGPARHGLGLRAYRSLTGLAAPAAPLLLGLRERSGKEDAGRRRERMGEASRERPEGALVWLHAASVGEINAILPLIASLRASRPDLRVLVTTVTMTAAEIAARRLGPGDIHQYVPLDAPQFVRRFLDHWRPDLAVFAESEIWPNLILEAGQRGIPLALVNARMSQRSHGRWRRNARFARSLFSRFDIVLAQNERLARRFGELGSRRVEVAGNLKIDAPPPVADPAALEELRADLAGRPLLLAASTHAGEEEIVAGAHRRLAADLPGFATIIVPRHPGRGPEIAATMARLGLASGRRAQGGQGPRGLDVYIADTLGELGTFYALSPIAFVGGSLIEHGGQNPVEAVRHGAAVLTGPSRYNFLDAYDALLRRGGALEVTSAETLAETVRRLLGDERELARMRANATAALASLSGALARTVAALLPLLPAPPPDEGLRRAG